MKLFSTIVAAAALLATQALGADLPLKAPALQRALAAGYTGSGFYVGGNMGGGGGSVNTSASTVGPMNQVDLQALIGVTVGYAFRMSPSTWMAAEADFDMMNLNTGGSGLPITLTGPADFEQRVLFGFPVAAFLSMLPVQLSGIGSLNALPPFNALPPGVTVVPSAYQMYVFGGLDEKDVSANVGAMSNKVWLVAPELGFGERDLLSNGFARDTSIAVQFDSKGLCVGAPTIGNGCGNLGMQVIGKLKLLW